MKRGSPEKKFDSCEDFKRACGSQCFQYIAKTALASGLAFNEKKIRIHQATFEIHEKCAGCEMHLDFCGGKQTCIHGCGQVVGCDWNFCQAKEDLHTCATCGKTGWCTYSDIDSIAYCKKCKKAICGNIMCFSICEECPNDMCDKCSTGQIVEVGGRLLCDQHKETTVRSCVKCFSEGRRDWKMCKDFRCALIKCAHTSTHIDYCQEHAADHK
jgi:hypothetical protein